MPPPRPHIPRQKQCSRKTYHSVTTYAASTRPLLGPVSPGLPFSGEPRIHLPSSHRLPTRRTPCGKPGEALAQPRTSPWEPARDRRPLRPVRASPPLRDPEARPLIAFQAAGGLPAPVMCGQGARAASRAPACDRPPNALAQLRPAPQAPARSAPDRGIGEAGSGRRPWSAVAPRGFVRPPTPGHRPDPARTPKLAPQGSLMSTRFRTERGWGCIQPSDTGLSARAACHMSCRREKVNSCLVAVLGASAWLSVCPLRGRPLWNGALVPHRWLSGQV